MTIPVPDVLPVDPTWFSATAHSNAVTQLSEPHVHPFLRSNLWHVKGRDRDLLVDTGMGIGELRAAFPDLFDREPIVFVTHGHFDHTGGAHEFADIRCHVAEAPALEVPEESTLVPIEMSESFAAALAADTPGGIAPPYLVDAIPNDEFDVASYDIVPVAPTPMLDGARIDLGDRTFEVLHLPGHTPGSAGLFESETGTLFTGDVVYDGGLLDELPESNIPDYVASMLRLGTMEPNIVHAGHEPSFGADRLHELVDEYLTWRG